MYVCMYVNICKHMYAIVSSSCQTNLCWTSLRRHERMESMMNPDRGTMNQRSRPWRCCRGDDNNNNVINNNNSTTTTTTTTAAAATTTPTTATATAATATTTTTTTTNDYYYYTYHC